MADPLLPLAPLPFRRLVDDAMHQTRRAFRSLWWHFALPIALLGGVMGVVQVFYTSKVLSLAEEGTEAFWEIGLWLLAIFAVALVMGYVYCAFFAATVRFGAGRPDPLVGVWRTCLRPRFFGTLILTGLCFLAGAALCFFPALWVALVLAFVVPVMVDEEVYGLAALKRSSALVRYNPHGRFVDNPMVKVFLLMMIGGALGYIVSIVLTLPFSLVQQVMLFREAASADGDMMAATSGWLWLSVPAQLLGAIGSSAVQLYLFSGLTLLFFDCRRRREGQDLEEAVAWIEARHAATAPETP